MSDPKTILIVEDDDTLREAMRLVLVDEGFEVEEARTGTEGLARLQNGFLPSLILLDLMMPEMSGEEFLEAQLASPALRNIPVIVWSGGKVHLERARRLGAQVCLEKPIDLELFLRHVRRCMGR